MYKITLFLLFALAMCSSDYSDYDYGNSHLYYIKFNKRYTVDVNRYPDRYLPAGHSYYFGLAVEPDDEMHVECRVQPDAVIDFKVDVCPFYSEPSPAELITGNAACANGLKGTMSKESDHDLYVYPFSTSTNVYYISAHLQNSHSLYYLDVLIYSEKGMGLALLILIICLPCIIVAAIVIFICRKLGCIRVTSSSVSGGTTYI